MKTYWVQHKTKLRSLLDQGYTPSKDPLVFLEEFPEKNITAISRATRRYGRDILSRLQGKSTGVEKTSEELPPPNKPQLPKILIFDLETSPMEFYGWRLGKQFIRPHQVIKSRACLSWAAKWLCSDEILSEAVTIEEAQARTDESIIAKLWNLFEEADILIAHNLKYFDLKMANTRFIKNGLTPTTPYQTIDTLYEARKHFNFPSNSLNEIGKEFGLHEKIDTNFALWDRCVTGHKDAIEEMVAYNKQDIVVLEDIYFKFRPWIKSHPNMGLFVESYSPVCPNCGSYNLDKKGFYYTSVGKYQAFRCNVCGAIGRNRHTVYPEMKRNALVASTAR